MRPGWVRVTDSRSDRRRESVVQIGKDGADVEVRDCRSESGRHSIPTDEIRELFALISLDDEGYAAINEQREAVLAPEWSRALAWLPDALSGSGGVVADVEPSHVGLVEEAARRAGIPCRLGLRSLVPRWSRCTFLLGEVLAKGILAGASPGRVSVDYLFYSEVPNHWRHLRPIAAEMRDRAGVVGFLEAAIGGARPLVRCDLDGIADYSFDRAALRPGVFWGLVWASLTMRPVGIEGSDLSRRARAGLRSRALFSRLVYEKGRRVASVLKCGVLVLGDASAHRPAGICAGLRDLGVPTISMQHGVVGDRTRYQQYADWFMVWDVESAEASAQQRAQCVVVGTPALEAECGVAVEGDTKRGGVLLAPSFMGLSDLVSWVEQATCVASSLLATPRVRVRLHPATPSSVSEALLGAMDVVLVQPGETVAMSILGADFVVSDGSSVLTEARLLGRRAVSLASDAGAEWVLTEVLSGKANPPALAGSIRRAAEVIDRVCRHRELTS